MSEWWTYRVSSFLLFSPRTYDRLFELYNRAIWPAQVAAAAAGFAVLVFVVRPSPRRDRWVAAILAAGWFWVAFGFHAARYATINWAAVDFAWAFALEAVLLLWTGVVRGRLSLEGSPTTARRGAVAILVLAVALYPALAPLLRHGWRSAEIFGLAPDPTAVGTLGVIAAAASPARWALFVVPVLWCAVTGAMLGAMESPEAWVAPVAAVLAVAISAGRRPRKPRS